MYPTKEEILSEPQLHRPEVIGIVRNWKRTEWKEAKNGSDDLKFLALKSLIQRIALIYDKQVNVVYKADAPSCCYIPMFNNAIVINRTLSIISSLHELAHALFGPDETKACRWSVWLFRKTFKKAYERLEWRGHRLVKRQEEYAVVQSGPGGEGSPEVQD